LQAVKLDLAATQQNPSEIAQIRQPKLLSLRIPYKQTGNTAAVLKSFCGSKQMRLIDFGKMCKQGQRNELLEDRQQYAEENCGHEPRIIHQIHQFDILCGKDKTW
jgi:hypothetical protein